MFAVFMKRSLLLPLLAVPLLLSSCGGDYNPELDEAGNSNVRSGLQLNVPVKPAVSYPNDGQGTTQMIVQFSAKDRNGMPLGADEFDVQVLVDDKPVDVESLANQSAQELEVNLYFGMVLDTSYSMVYNNSPAFGLMKQAASDSYQEVIDLWKNRPGKVKFSTIWFDSLLNQSLNGSGGATMWQPADLLTIPPPQQGSYTKLHSAVETMAKQMKADYDSGVFNGPRDQYVMLVFSDGTDNYSWHDNSAFSNAPLFTGNGASYRQFGTKGPASKKPEDALQQAIDAINNHPRLTTHVIGLGNEINSSELQKLATAGHGVFQANPSSDKLAEVFDRVTKEFTTLQTRLVTVPLPPNDYKISLVVTNKATGESGRYDFTIHAGDTNAKLISAP